MNNVDLIPASYNRLQKVKGHVKLFVLFFPMILILIGCGKFLFNHLISKEKLTSAALQSSAASIQKEKSRIDLLHLQKNDLIKRLNLFRSLRGGSAIEQIFVVIDRAINPNIWLTNWVFLRSGERSEAKKRGAAKNTGYFLVVPKGSGHDEEKPWQNREHMKLYGEAKTFADLADFIKSFNKQPEVEDVLVQQTRLQDTGDVPAVSFAIIVVLTGEVKE